MLLLVSCISTHNHLLEFARFCAGLNPKIANKNKQQGTLPDFITIPSINYDIYDESPGQTESQVDASSQLASTCDSVWPGPCVDLR